MEHDSASSSFSVRRIDRAISYIVSHAYVKTLTFVAAFLEGIISPLPPEVLVAAVLAYRKDISWKLVSVISAFGSALGLSTLYFLGKYMYASHEAFFAQYLSLHAGAVAQSILKGSPLTGAFFSTFTPLVDRIFTLSAGVFQVAFLPVLIGLFLGRLFRVGVVAYCSHRFGPEARKYVVRHSRVALAVGLLLVLYSVLKVLGIL